MNNFKIGTRIAAGFTAVILIAISLVLFAYIELVSIDRASNVITSGNLRGIYITGQIKSLQERKLQLLLEHAFCG